jgi:hypothetical protein
MYYYTCVVMAIERIPKSFSNVYAFQGNFSKWSVGKREVDQIAHSRPHNVGMSAFTCFLLST